MDSPRPVDFVRHLGAGLLGPLGLVAITGAAVFLLHGTGPDGLPRYAGAGRAGPEYVRTLHLWSSRILIAATIVHVVRVWADRLTGPRHRATHLAGSLAFLTILLAHGTGHVLRWDDAGQRISAALGNPDAPGALTLPLHAGLLPILLGMLVALHVATVRSGALVRAAPDEPPVGRPAALLAGGGLVLLILLIGALLPARDATGVPWPFGPFAWLADEARIAALLPLAVVAAWLLVAAQPYLHGRRWAAWPTRALLGIVAAATLAPPPP